MTKEKKLEFYETNVSLLWFLMDGLWMMGWKIMPVILSFPAVVLGCLIFIYVDRTPRFLAITIAGSTWMFMDICWMIGDNFEIGIFNILSHIMFWITFLCLAYSLTKSKDYRESVTEVLSGFRRMKIKK